MKISVTPRKFPKVISSNKKYISKPIKNKTNCDTRKWINGTDSFNKNDNQISKRKWVK